MPMLEFNRHRTVAIGMLNPTIGHFVATTTNYTDDTPLSQMNKFWVAQVVDVDPSTSEVQVKWYSTGSIDNLSNTAGGRSNRARYRLWTGANRIEWIAMSRVLVQFDNLTEKSRLITNEHLRKIRSKIQGETDSQRPMAPPAKRRRIKQSIAVMYAPDIP